MNRRKFLVSAGYFVGSISILRSLPKTCEASSIVWPETSYDLDDIYEIHWTGFIGDINTSKQVGKWLAHPKKKYIFIQSTSVQSTVVCFAEDSEISKREAVQDGLNTLLEIIEKGIEIARKFGIKGCVPIDCVGEVDRQFLSQMRREHIRLGVWPQ